MGSQRSFHDKYNPDVSHAVADRANHFVELRDRRVDDRLPDSFALARSESEWLLTLLSAEELRYIFEGPAGDEIET